jgi:hypothetical protein
MYLLFSCIQAFTHSDYDYVIIELLNFLNFDFEIGNWVEWREAGMHWECNDCSHSDPEEDWDRGTEGLTS